MQNHTLFSTLLKKALLFLYFGRNIHGATVIKLDVNNNLNNIPKPMTDKAITNCIDLPVVPVLDDLTILSTRRPLALLDSSSYYMQI